MYNSSTVTTFYVSQKNGNDYWAGFYSEVRDDFRGPLKSIEKAIEKVSELRRIGAFQPVSIVICDDVYSVSEPIVINQTAFGITIKALNETVISGGIKIEGFVNDEFNGCKCFSAPVNQIDEGIWFTDLYVDDMRADFTSYPKERFLTPESVENESIKLFDSSKWFIAKKEDLEDIKKFRNFGDCL